MTYRLKSAVPSDVLAAGLGLDHIGTATPITGVAALGDAGGGDLTFSKRPPAQALSDGAIVICPPHSRHSGGAAIIATNPRLAFMRALARLEESRGFERNEAEPVVDPSVQIGSNAVIEPGVTIGPRTRIEHGVVLHSGVRIGERCVIKANSVIGGDGFGFERDEKGRPIRFIHLGSVVIHDDVEIGALNTVVRGSLGDTVVGARTKADDHVHIAHNVTIGEDCLITACAEISGGVKIGNRVWIGPNAAIMQKVEIGDDVIVGLGAVITKSVEPGLTVTGNPAEELRLLSRKRAAVSALIKGE